MGTRAISRAFPGNSWADGQPEKRCGAQQALPPDTLPQSQLTRGEAKESARD